MPGGAQGHAEVLCRLSAHRLAWRIWIPTSICTSLLPSEEPVLRVGAFLPGTVLTDTSIKKAATDLKLL